jgi:hypothetical protein
MVMATDGGRTMLMVMAGKLLFPDVFLMVVVELSRV